jgi:hypothetical protein
MEHVIPPSSNIYRFNFFISILIIHLIKKFKVIKNQIYTWQANVRIPNFAILSSRF